MDSVREEELREDELSMAIDKLANYLNTSQGSNQPSSHNLGGLEDTAILNSMRSIVEDVNRRAEASSQAKNATTPPPATLPTSARKQSPPKTARTSNNSMLQSLLQPTNSGAKRTRSPFAGGGGGGHKRVVSATIPSTEISKKTISNA